MDFISEIMTYWSYFKDYILPIMGSLMFVVGAWVMHEGQGKMVSTIGKVLIAGGFMFWGPTLIGLGANH
jgi:hypothetical protein